jgi:ABC-type cobalamin transport system ATPase subunit
MAESGYGKTVDKGYKEKRRSLQQNARMWAMLSDVARQVVWHGQKLSAEDWKCMATAALKRQRVVPGIEGGVVVLGEPTKHMSIAQMAELMEFLEAFGAQHDVKFSAPEWRTAVAA